VDVGLEDNAVVTGGGRPIVLCGTDGRTNHDPTVRLAADVAEDLAAAVLVLHVPRHSLAAGIDASAAGVAALWAAQLQEQSLATAAMILQERGVPGTVRATDGPPVRELIRLADAMAARAIVVSACPYTRHRARLHLCPGRALERRAPCFVLRAE